MPTATARMERFTRYKLEAHERPRHLYEYHVTGTGTFPFDMLRFDGCWPATGEDAAEIYNTIESNIEDTRPRRSIKLRSYKEPTVARWHSFTWSVSVDTWSQHDA